MLARSSVQREEAMKEIAARYEEMERSGELYVTTCEIIFPPQAAEKHRLGGVVVEIGTVLSWLADNCQTENPQHASLLREIAEEFYPEDEDDGYDEDDFVLSDDVAEKLESVLSGPHAIVEEIS